MGVWGGFITVAIHRAEEILVRQNKELFAAEKAAEHAEIRRQLEVKEKDMEITRLRNVELKNSNDEIALRNKMIEEEKRKSETLLLNILPEETANELLREGVAKSHKYEMVTVMFTDFVDFTHNAEQLKAEDLVKQMDKFFRAFDEITLKYGVEKIKTIGDAYMCAGGLPIPNTSNPTDVLNAAIEIAAYMQQENKDQFRMRIGIHTGPVVAGVVGKHKFQYDIWGDAVNIAARMEQNSVPGKINISGATYELVKEHFNCEYRGKINAKNKGDMEMYFVNGKVSG
jgi:adenylate cyclase